MATQTDFLELCSRIEVATQTDLPAIHTDEAITQTDLCIDFSEAATQTEEETNGTTHPGKSVCDGYSCTTLISCNLDKESNEEIISAADTILSGYMHCEGNSDEKFAPLIERHKGVFKDASGNFLLLSDTVFNCC